MKYTLIGHLAIAEAQTANSRNFWPTDKLLAIAKAQTQKIQKKLAQMSNKQSRDIMKPVSRRSLE